MSRPARDNARRTGPALEKAYQFMLWLVPTVEKFPRSQKFLLGDRMQGAALDVIEDLIEATYTKDGRAALRRANLKLQKLRYLWDGRLFGVGSDKRISESPLHFGCNSATPHFRSS